MMKMQKHLGQTGKNSDHENVVLLENSVCLYFKTFWKIHVVKDICRKKIYQIYIGKPNVLRRRRKREVRRYLILYTKSMESLIVMYTL